MLGNFLVYKNWHKMFVDPCNIETLTYMVHWFFKSIYRGFARATMLYLKHLDILTSGVDAQKRMHVTL